MRSEKASDTGRTIGRKDAAKVLNDLKLCKAYAPNGKINNANIQRFGRQDESGKWSWNLAELIEMARKKGTASSEVIQETARAYTPAPGSTGSRPSTPIPTDGSPRPKSRAELKQAFQDQVLRLEAAMKDLLPWKQSGEDRRTLGKLIGEGKTTGLIDYVDDAELSFVNQVRNSLLHARKVNISDDRLVRATASAEALSRTL